MATWVIHGFNVSDGGKGSVDRLIPHLDGPVGDFDYGFSHVLNLRCVNKRAVEQLLRLVKPGDMLVGHSNGALLAWEVANKLPNKLAAVVTINAAMRRDTLWPKDLPVLNLHNSTDNVVQLGRAWSRMVSFGGLSPHGWGAAGKYGFTGSQKSVRNWDTAMGHWEHPVQGHSGMFQTTQTATYWGQLMNSWLRLIRRNEQLFSPRGVFKE